MCFSDTGQMTKLGRKPRSLDFVGKDAPPKNAVVGWRAWKVKREGQNATLVSPLRDSRWVPGKGMKGEVELKKQGGVYCFKTISALKRYTTIKQDASDIVIGQCLLWGKGAEHKDGYRAENAYPFKLWTNDIRVQSILRDQYKSSVQIGYARNLKAA